MGAIFQVNLPYKVRCELGGCGKPVNLVAKMQMENGEMATFCSSYHANLGEERWEEKKKMNIKPGQPILLETEEAEADNLLDLEEGVS